MVGFVTHVVPTVLGFATAWAVNGSYLHSKPSTECASKKKKAHLSFSPDEYKSYKLLSSRYESHDTRRFYFALDDADDEFNMPIASCVILKFTDVEGNDIIRPYTPISMNGTKGHFELIVKKYHKGKMGTHLFNMQPGEELLVKGPFEKFAYKPNMWSHVGMIAGGTGIAPMYQVICSILNNPKDKTKISLIYANNQRRDILLANELTEFQKVFNNFNMYLTLLEVPRRWLGGIGFINKSMLETFMPKPNEKHTKILICGPPPMLKTICGDKVFESGKPPQQGPLLGLLSELGYKEDQVFKYERNSILPHLTPKSPYNFKNLHYFLCNKLEFLQM